ncbi:MAG: DUF3995 domain-containing protein [Solirubrobacteraceae bacterium]
MDMTSQATSSGSRGRALSEGGSGGRAVSEGESRGRAFALASLALGLAYALVSAYWGVGGTGLLDTVGGVFERAGRSGGMAIFVLLWTVVVVKMIAAVLPLLAIRPGGPRLPRRVTRRLGWTEAVILTVYGLVLSVGGWLVQANVVAAGAHANHRALAWHAYLWDPWFLLWGLSALAALYRSRGTSALT